MSTWAPAWRGRPRWSVVRLSGGPVTASSPASIAALAAVHAAAGVPGPNPSDYRLDIYDPEGTEDTYLSRTTGVAAAKMAVDLFGNVFTLNYEPLIGPDGVEPSISEWIPST
jgi:hypothetical protein